MAGCKNSYLGQKLQEDGEGWVGAAKLAEGRDHSRDVFLDDLLRAVLRAEMRHDRLGDGSSVEDIFGALRFLLFARRSTDDRFQNSERRGSSVVNKMGGV